MKPFSFTYGNLNLTSCDVHLLIESEKPHVTAAIRRQCPDYQIVIAYWKEHAEGYDLKFVGDRPFSKEVNWTDFRELAQTGQALLTLWFEETEDE